MLKMMVKLESIVADKVGHFLIENDTPLAVIKEMLFQMQKYIGQVEDQSKAMQEAAKNSPESAPSEPASVVVEPTQNIEPIQQ